MGKIKTVLLVSKDKAKDTMRVNKGDYEADPKAYKGWELAETETPADTDPEDGDDTDNEGAVELPSLDGLNKNEAKDALEAWAREHFEVELDKSKSFEVVLEEAQALAANAE